ncbi:hypothetical protein COLO4_08586 [Corchorus olitorius]|uniref:Uncharacterized protein n=1 Tax=Corchorus olitorius TaxID=93759 RepID=A0A1R3KFE5_9ROSI|nr:hypothetical protein COLO4_08586 [Corchorus olitorius]
MSRIQTYGVEESQQRSFELNPSSVEGPVRWPGGVEISGGSEGGGRVSGKIRL